MRKYNKTSFSFLKNFLNHKKVAKRISLFANANEVTVIKFGKGAKLRILAENVTAFAESIPKNEPILLIDSPLTFRDITSLAY